MARSAAIMLSVWLTCGVANGQVVACPGDCNGDGEVTINELERLVAIVLEVVVDPCPAGDVDHSGDITINEVVVAVNAALAGCPQAESTPSGTPTPPPPTASATPTATAEPTPEEFVAQASDFDDFATWPQVRDYRLTNKLGQLTEALAVADALGDTPEIQLPIGTIVQLVPGEAMVKRGGDFQPEHKGWEYFVLGSNGGRTQIIARGGIETNGGSCYGCHQRARTFDYLCETTHDCSQ